jgi:predicted PurR-regulated permease PerM
MDKEHPHLISISTGTILKLVGILIVAVFLYAIRDILLIFFVALVFASAVDPWIDQFHRAGFPRALGIFMIYLIVIGVLTIVSILIIPPITQQVSDIAQNFPTYYERLLSGFAFIQQYSTDTDGVAQNIQSSLDALSKSLLSFTGGVYGALSGFVGAIFYLLAVMVLTFYMTVEEKGLKNFIQSFLPAKYQPYLAKKANQIQEKMGMWLRGQLILVLIIGALSFIGLTILQVKYALVLAMIAGISELIPYVGPIIGAIPAVFLASSESLLKAGLVIILYVVIQQLENQIIVPKVMQRSVGLSPLVIIIVMLIGARLAGVVGLLLAVPTATIASIFLKDFFEGRRQEETELETEE